MRAGMGRSGLGGRVLGWRARAGTEATGCGRGAALACGDAVPARARRATSRCGAASASPQLLRSALL
jgi:hypothetical protein